MRQRIWVKHHLKIIPSLCFSRNLAKNPSLAPLSWCPKLEVHKDESKLKLVPFTPGPLTAYIQNPWCD